MLVEEHPENNSWSHHYLNTVRTELDNRIARMFYTGGLLFYFVRNPNYHNSYAYATTYHISGYVPLGYNALRTTILQKERANIERLLKPIKDSWLANVLSIVSEGRSDPQRGLLLILWMHQMGVQCL